MSKNIPPHLPKPMSNIKTHQLRERLKIISLAALISLLSGLAGASVLFGWLLPNGYGNNIFISSQNKTDTNQPLEDLVQKELMEKIYNVYTKISKNGGIEYAENKDWLGQAISISSDGWLVMYVTKDLSNLDIYLINTKNISEKVVQKVFDKQTGFLFIKIEPVNKPKPVGIKNDVATDDPIYLFDNENWVENYVNKKLISDLGSHLDIAPINKYLAKNKLLTNYPVFDGQGNLVGFAISDEKIIPSKYLSRIISNFLSNKIITYNSLGVNGFFLTEKNIINTNNLNNAFIIESIHSFQQNKLRVGDIITEINKSVVNEDSLWYNISNKTSVNITLLRNGKTVQVDNVPVLNL